MANPRLRDIVQNAASGDWNIPEFQREFEWKPEQVAMLFNSLHRDLPVGLLIVWNTNKYNEPQRTTVTGRMPFWVIDGQQRVTSFCIMSGTKPNWLDNDDWNKIFNKNRIYLNIEQNGNTFVGRLFKKSSVTIPIDELIHREPSEVLKIVQGSCSEAGVENSEQACNNAVNTLQILERVIPLEEVGDDKEIEDIADLYIRLNKQGTKLTQAQIMLAWVSQYNPGWVRSQFYPFLEELEDKDEWRLDPTHILQVAAIITEGKARVGQASTELWKSRIAQSWKRIKSGVELAILELWERGVTGPEMVPSNYTIVALFSMVTKFCELAGYDFDKLYKWFIQANLKGRYGDAPLETLAADGSSIYKAQNFDEALREIDVGMAKEDLEKVVNEKFRINSSQALLMNALLWSDNVRDWYEPYGLPTLTKAPRNLEPHWHHILPKAWGRSNGFEDCDYTANVTRICAKTNVKKLSSKPPWEYVPENEIEKEGLVAHFVPNIYAEKFVKGQVISPVEFKDFLKAREKIIVSKSESLLGIKY